MGHDDISRQPFSKMVGGFRGEVFDRAGSLQAAKISFLPARAADHAMFGHSF
jgi:hypothetical protein